MFNSRFRTKGEAEEHEERMKKLMELEEFFEKREDELSQKLYELARTVREETQ